ncbi:tryptophan synthase subunit alpha [Helicobacter sp. MIT 11-5569]|uniref:tryptophan synthase subunit alpha n=1 Tax=Helicobacter sp. MIT 11-5569 TaxID=1548151 RepID=UPI00051FC6BF|nr:tryptophan synthase subunit alpha [Helicobacter sp. MIT 11-5569]TLD85206.1 tryptophan synthase subunit alpha [Helicobacter sp. MIT 11-5569]
MKEIALMGHIVAGFPNFETSLEAAFGICLGGAKYLEVQFPFSDPNADGITITNACAVALENGFNTDLGFEFITQLQQKLAHSGITTKLLIMTYGNILFCYGIESFLKKAKLCGVYGLIVPDLSWGNDEKLFAKARKMGLENIALIAPQTKPKRIEKLSNASGAFVYVVARNGITGDTTQINESLMQYICVVKAHCQKPIALGFGIQSKEQIDALRGVVPIAIVGSAFVRYIDKICKKSENANGEIANKLCAFTQGLWGESKES